MPTAAPNHLTPDECRILGVLIEKAHTTPAQYPLTLNALVTGANQKSNRDPTLELDEDRALDAIDRLKAKGFAREAMLSGSRVAKYRHVAREALGVTTPELVILAELLLRGPQTLGELRARAARMHPLGPLEAVQSVLDALTAPAPAATPGQPDRPALAERLPPGHGSRAERYAQLLCPGLHPVDHSAPEGDGALSAPAPARGDADPDPADHELAARVVTLEREVQTLRAALRALAAALGEPDPLGAIV